MEQPHPPYLWGASGQGYRHIFWRPVLGFLTARLRVSKRTISTFLHDLRHWHQPWSGFGGPWLVDHYVFSNMYSNFWLIFGKLWEARSRLYRSRFFQVNTLWKLLTRSTRFPSCCTATSSKIQQKKSSDIFQNEYSFFTIPHFLNSCPWAFAIFTFNLDQNLSEFPSISWNNSEIANILSEFAESMPNLAQHF